MKKVIMLAMMAAAAMFSACALDGTHKETMSEDAAFSLSTSFKGWELYSWKANATWQYSLLVGTNRAKSFEEITAADSVITGEQALMDKIRTIARGDQIFWNMGNIKGFEYPPADIIEKVQDLCEKRSIKLEKVDW